MMFWTHLLFGFLVGVLGIIYFNPTNQIIFMLMSLTGSVLPDIDHPNSKIGKKIPLIPLFFKHRGIFHTFFASLLVVSSVYILDLIYAIPLTIGFVSHLILDSITKEGIKPFHPISKFRLKGPIYTGKLIEWMILIGLFVSSILALIKI